MKNKLIITSGLLIIILGLFIGFHTSCKSKVLDKSIHGLIQKDTDDIYDSLVKIRRDFHMYPELSEHEKRTSQKIESYLLALGLEVRTNIGGYGVVGILKGNKDGKHIAWRADIDAFQSDFPDLVEFESQIKGVRHICGHDVHATIGLGIANILSKHKDKINGTIYFIFQPAEETFRGAEKMIEDGLFNIINPSEIYALHMAPLPVGVITSKKNEVFSYYRTLKIKMKGISKENEVSSYFRIPNIVMKGSSNEDAIIKYTQNLIKSYNTVDEQFWNRENLENPQIGISNPQSIYKNYLAIQEPFKIKKEDDLLEISIFLIGTDINVIESLPMKLKKTIENSPYADNLDSISYIKSYPTVNNDSKLTQETLNTIQEIYGQSSVIPSFGVAYGSNDDFAYFQHHVPGVYFFLGGSNSIPHSPNFEVDEECIKVGVKYFSSMIIERLKNE
jgi:metal-dependent amidase/aminoacylase/carboxypeptidase family protein